MKIAYPNTLDLKSQSGIRIAYPAEEAVLEDGWIFGPNKTAIYFAPVDLEGEYTLPNSVKFIGSGAFYNCNLSKIIVNHATPPILSEYGFDTYYTTLLSIPKESTDKYLATNWNKFSNIERDNGEKIETIHYTLDGLDYLLNVNDFTAIITRLVSYIRDITIPERITYDSGDTPERYYIKAIGSNAFADESLYSIQFTSRANIEYIGDRAFANTRLKEITLPSTVLEFGDSVFANCDYLEKATINSTAGITNGMFKNCRKLETVSIAEGNKVIGDYAFYNTNLRNLPLIEGIEVIGKAAFSMDEDRYAANNTGEIKIPSTLKSIGADAFFYRSNSKVSITDLRAWCDIDFENNDSNPAGWSNNGLWLDGAELTDLIIPDGVEEIKPYSFVINLVSDGWFDVTSTRSELRRHGRLKSVVIPASVKSIGTEAFQCNGFTSLTIPASVERIGERAFAPGNITLSLYYRDTYADNVIITPVDLDTVIKSKSF